MSRSYLVSASVAPCRFVKLDSSASGYVLHAGAGEVAIGISQPGTRLPPIDGYEDGYAAVQNVEAITVYEAGDECWVEAGGAISHGDLLKPSTAGVAITASSDGNIYSAQALQPATASGELIRVKVLPPSFRGA